MKGKPRSSARLISPDEAREIILSAVKPGPRETAPIAKVCCRVLAAPVRADRDYPPFYRSAMDGYAVRSRDVAAGGELRCLGVLPAGETWRGRVGKGQCVQIMTGAPVPAGADAVVKVEDTESGEEDLVRFRTGCKPRENVARRGEDARRGKTVLASGTVLTPAAMATLASLGAREVTIHTAPAVAVVVTGNEIVGSDRTPRPDQIRDCNSVTIREFLAELRLKPRSKRAAVDRKDALLRKLESALESEFVIVSGGVSKGDFDYVPEVMEELGVRWKVSGVRMKPGKPLHFGLGPGGQAVFGLPGNPVSVMVALNEFVLPALRRRMGYPRCGPPKFSVVLSKSVRPPSGRTGFRLARLTDGDGGTAAEPLPSHGSGDFISAGLADGTIVLPAGGPEVPAGNPVEFHPWRT